ncbi:MAG TPA: thiamine diphosphokinase [Acidimicrobiia bacterium]|nr:thiamine diphosphokinase [Acidimicrobiia bacterium]
MSSESSTPSACRRAVVLAGGDPVGSEAQRFVLGDALVVAADSGVHQAAALGVRIDVVVGDLDSVDRAALDAAVASGASVEEHPVAKDATDLELALATARRLGAQEVVVLGAGGGRRLDHFLGNVLLLTSPDFADLRLTAFVDGALLTTLHAAHGAVELDGAPGGLVTLLAVGGPAHGVHTTGLRYPLRGEVLHPGSTRGVSNELLGTRASVALERGTLLAVQPLDREFA